jgi:DNA-binding NarL/FixJ family response regulator
MSKQITIVVIATRSISLADGLEALLKAIPEIEKVEIVRTMANAVQQVEDIKPRILLLDLALSGRESEAFLEKIFLLSPKTLRVLLVDDLQDLKWKPQFAEAILLKGGSPSEVAMVVTNLLFLKGDKNEKTNQ